MRQRVICGHPRLDQRTSACRGQSTLEYILIIAAILVAVVAAAGTLIKPAVTKTMTDSGDVIKAASGKVKTGLGL